MMLQAEEHVIKLMIQRDRQRLARANVPPSGAAPGWQGRNAAEARVRNGSDAQPSMPGAGTEAAGEGNGVEGTEASQVD
eukprot:gene12485-15696_t